jgi:hypothetical protein
VFVNLLDLATMDIKGRRANVIQPIYRPQFERYPNGMIKTLDRIETRTIKGRTWMYLYWDKDEANHPYDCGFSGWDISYLDPTTIVIEFVDQVAP